MTDQSTRANLCISLARLTAIARCLRDDTTLLDALPIVEMVAINVHSAKPLEVADLSGSVSGRGSDDMLAATGSLRVVKAPVNLEGAADTNDQLADAPVLNPDGISTSPVASESSADPRSPVGANPWTAAEDARLIALCDGVNDWRTIADAIGRSERAVQQRKARLIAKGLFNAAEVKARIQKVSACPSLIQNLAQKIAAALGALDDSFTPADDLALIEGRLRGVPFEDIAEEIGTDESTAKARWRDILRCNVPATGGIITQQGREELLSAARIRADA